MDPKTVVFIFYFFNIASDIIILYSSCTLDTNKHITLCLFYMKWKSQDKHCIGKTYTNTVFEKQYTNTNRNTESIASTSK